MFLGDLVKLKQDTVRTSSKTKADFVENAKRDDWIWLVTSIDDEDLDYIIRPIYLYSECSNMTQLGEELMVLHDEIKKVEISREELFNKLSLLD